MSTLYRVGQKTGPFLNVDNFAVVSGRKACDMPLHYLQILSRKNIKLA